MSHSDTSNTESLTSDHHSPSSVVNNWSPIDKSSDAGSANAATSKAFAHLQGLTVLRSSLLNADEKAPQTDSINSTSLNLICIAILWSSLCVIPRSEAMYSLSGSRQQGSSRKPSSTVASSAWRLREPSSVQQTFGYDPDTGLAFSESQIRVSGRQAHDWIGEPRSNAKPKSTKHHNVSGAASLQDMAVRCVARSIRSITADHLYEVPWPTAKKIWQDILER